jgi:hypothetical protein
VAAGTAGHFVNNGLNTYARGYINDTYADMTTLNRTAGNLAGSAIEYGMTGSATYNVASMYGTGALEMHLGGDGPMFNLGRSGYNMDYETLMQSIQGFDGYRQNARIAKSSVDDDYTAAMRMSYSSGGTDSQTRALYEQLLSGAAVIEKGSEGTARTKMENGIRTVYMDELSGRNSDLHYGVVLSHEAMRNGLDDGEEGQLRETWQTVLQHSLVAQSVGAIYGDDSLTGDMQQEVELLKDAIKSGDFSAFGEHALSSYDSTKDYWRLMNDGTIEWDGKRGLYDENGKLVRLAVDENGMTLGYGESLLEYMGRENAESWLSEQGQDVAGLTTSELGDALMALLPLEWTASSVPVDPNMGELIGSNYVTSRNAWLGNSYQIVRGGDGETFIDYGGVIAPGFAASQDVLDQVSLRDGIIADMMTFENAIANGHGSPTALGDFAMSIRERQTEYNQQYVKSGMAFTPENFISQQFRNELNRYQLSDGSYISYVHSGLDTVGNSQVVSPGFMEVVDIPAALQRNYGEVFG